MTAAELDEYVAEAQASIEDAVAENPDVNEDDVVHDIAMSLSHGLSPKQAKEFQQRLGIYV